MIDTSWDEECDVIVVGSLRRVLRRRGRQSLLLFSAETERLLAPLLRSAAVVADPLLVRTMVALAV